MGARTVASPRVRRLAEWLETGAPLGADTLDVVTRELARILRTDQVVAYGLDSREGIPRLAFLKSTLGQAPEVKRQVGSLIEKNPSSFGHYDPCCPPVGQRNTAVTLHDLRRITGIPTSPMRRLVAGLGLATRDQLWVLICDGPHLFAWVGALRDHPFREDERAVLQLLVRPLRRRLTQERRLEAVPWALEALEAFLDGLGVPAVVLRHPLRLLCCNALAQVMLARDRASVTAELREAMDGRGIGSWVVTPLAGIECARHVLAVRCRPPADPSALAAAAARRYGLTARQTQVLELVARGDANKSIAASLECSESAIEQHVTLLLRRHGVECRSQLVARFWMNAG